VSAAAAAAAAAAEVEGAAAARTGMGKTGGGEGEAGESGMPTIGEAGGLLTTTTGRYLGMVNESTTNCQLLKISLWSSVLSHSLACAHP
jgi:hypothetical protein